MDQNTVRPIRKVAISDKLWDCFDQMSKELGGDRESLIQQALFTFARLNGYLQPGYLTGTDAPAAPAERAKVGSGPAAAPARREVEVAVAPAPAPRREVESQLRRPSPPPPPPRAAEPPEEDEARREVAERVLETAAELERGLKDKQAENFREVPTREGFSPKDGAEKNLYLMAEDGNLDKVVKDRFVIGRGKHCDLVINSGKVSREHAAIVKEGADYFIEDLGSSNGTWFNKQRIRRRKIEDGDEFFICSEKVKCVVR
ncbi:MAG: FHA domain-containing protein [Myxococcales bacterium]